MEARVRPARRRDGPALVALYRDRRRWLLARGNRQWRDARFTAETVGRDIASGGMLVATWLGRIVGALQLTWRDPVFWPDRVVADAAYIGALVVARQVAGYGVSAHLLAAAAKRAARRRRWHLRLDCAPLPDLARLYRRLGFMLIDESSLGGYRVFRFERAYGPGR